MKTRKCDCDVQNDQQLGHFGDCVLIKQPQQAERSANEVSHTPTPWEFMPYNGMA